jgi:hypothetical protein
VQVGTAGLAGCNDNGLASPDAATAPDASSGADLLVLPDAGAQPDLPPSSVGMPCPTGNECPSGWLCLGQKIARSLPQDGYCTKSCMNDPDCGAGAFCGPPFLNGVNYCWTSCDANMQCAAPHRVCSRRLDGNFDLVKTACIPGNPNAKDGDPCVSFEDCNRSQACLVNPFESPGGLCLTIGCTIGDNTTCAPGGNPQCIAVGGTLNLCLAGCMANGDCRAAEGYVCQGAAPPKSGLCLYPHAKIGDACTKDTDCGLVGSPWHCLTGAPFTNGYCSGIRCDPSDDRTCPTNAHCVDPTPTTPQSGDEFCVKDCTTTADCRVADGYSCKPYDPNHPGMTACLP